jgi:hypothetical protein
MLPIVKAIKANATQDSILLVLLASIFKDYAKLANDMLRHAYIYIYIYVGKPFW